ncbi:MAG: restriction endonuclease subunit S [Treponema sp.]|nr:restriction endonuclease subunit S [Treponema sp.]
MSEWKKVKIGDICKIVKGTTGIASAEPGQYPLVVTAEERKTCSTYQFDCEAVCIPLVSSSGHGKKSLKNVHYQSGKFALGTILCAVIPNNPQELDARYLHQYLQFYKDIILVPLMKGAANVSLSMKDIATVEFPLPPIERQRELSNLFVSLQEKQKELSAEYEKQTEYAKLLRQNILQQAVEGKLTADWRKQNPVQKGNPDYDAEALFEQIQKGEVSPSLQPASQFSATPSAGSNAARNARSKSLTPITDGEKPFEIPEGWKWVRLGEIGNWASGATPSKSEAAYYANGTIPWLRTGDLNDNVISALPITITEKALNECSLRLNPIDSVLIAMYGATIGKVGILKTQATTNQACCACIPYQSNFSQYLFYLLIALRDYFKEKSWGAAQPNISKEIIIKTPFALPPLKEQEEIVNKVESLLAKVTELENQIQERKMLAEKLAFGIIKEKLEG